MSTDNYLTGTAPLSRREKTIIVLLCTAISWFTAIGMATTIYLIINAI